jgi:hypothetical protein
MKTLNGSPDFGNSIDENEIKYFLDNQQISIQLGTIDKKDDSNVYPISQYFCHIFQ